MPRMLNEMYTDGPGGVKCSCCGPVKAKAKDAEEARREILVQTAPVPDPYDGIDHEYDDRDDFDHLAPYTTKTGDPHDTEPEFIPDEL